MICINESSKYHKFLRQRGELANNPFIKDLYSLHFNQPLEGEALITPRTFERME